MVLVRIRKKFEETFRQPVKRKDVRSRFKAVTPQDSPFRRLEKTDVSFITGERTVAQAFKKPKKAKKSKRRTKRKIQARKKTPTRRRR